MRLGLRGRADPRPHLVHRAAAADETREAVPATGSGGTAESGGRCGACETRNGLRHPREPVAVAQHEVVGRPGLHRPDRRVGRVATAHHEYGEIRAPRAQCPHDVRRGAAIGVGGPDDDEPGPRVVRGGFGVARRRGHVPRRTRPPRRRDERGNAQWLVVQDEDVHGADT